MLEKVKTSNHMFMMYFVNQGSRGFKISRMKFFIRLSVKKN